MSDDRRIFILCLLLKILLSNLTITLFLNDILKVQDRYVLKIIKNSGNIMNILTTEYLGVYFILFINFIKLIIFIELCLYYN
jgi:hypothetical protein